MAQAENPIPQETGTDSMTNGLTNGVQNGTSSSHKSRDRDKDRDKDKDRHKSSHKDKDKDRHSSSHKSSHKDRDKDKEREKDKHKSSSSSSDKDKDRHKSSDRDKDKDRHKGSSSSSDKDKDRHKSSSDKDKERDKHKSSSDKDRHRDKDKDKDRHKSSSDKDKHRSSDKDKDRNKDKEESDKDKDKERSDKDKERSDKDKERSDKDKERSDKDKERSDKDKERSDKHKERSDKDKERSDKDKHKSSSSSSSSRDKDKDKDKDKHRSSDKDKDRHRDDKDKKHSSSSSGEKKDRDKDRHSSSKSSHKDKHRDKDRHREKDRHKEKTKESESSKNTDAATAAAAAPTEDVTSMDSSQDDVHRHTDEDCMAEPGQDPTFMEQEGDRSQDTTRGEVSAESEEEEDDKLVINVKEEPTETFIAEEEYKEKMEIDDRIPLAGTVAPKDELMAGSDDDVPLASRKVNKEEPMNESDDDVPLDSRKAAVKKEDEDEDDDDVPLSARKRVKEERTYNDEEDDDVPLSARRVKKEDKKKKKKRKEPSSDAEDDDDFKPKSKRAKVKKEKVKKEKTSPRKSGGFAPEVKSPSKRVKKESEEEKNIWKWWEEEKKTDGIKWNFLEHKGVVFAPPYEPLPSNIVLKYNGEVLVLSQNAEEVAGFYARMLEHDYVTKEQFNKNFFKDWRKVMTSKEREFITDLKKCDFRKMHLYYVQKNEDRKNRSKEEKKITKAETEAAVMEFGWATIDGHKQKIANFRVEPPGLFRGRGEHPRMGMLKHRIYPEDIILNCSKDSILPKAPEGHKWKEIRCDNQVTWLASWTENVQGQVKYVMLNASSKLKGEKDWMKYEKARHLHQIVNKIRVNYISDWKSKEMRIRQRAIALYFIDKLALRAGNEKDEDQADTVGCCSLRVEHITLYDSKDGKECVVAFDFLGKDSIRYYNEVAVEKRAYKNVKLFMENKQPADDLFDRLTTQILNKHLNELMDGLTAKVFRTYNASYTLQEQLKKFTDPDDDLPGKVLSYNRANREVAILCNHQRAVPKTFDQSMANLQGKIDEKKDQIIDGERDLKSLKKQARSSMKEKQLYDRKVKQIERVKDTLHKLEISATDKEENKQIALGTSKLNYLDPRISVSWCKKFDVNLEKVYNKTQRLKFQWAIEMAGADFNFLAKPKPMDYSMNNSMGNDDQDEEFDE